MQDHKLNHISELVNMIRIATIILYLLSAIALQGNPNVKHYIEKYKNIAISEMQRSGIPASVKLAQGIHESNMGQSDLAKFAHNHFGMKCGSSWSGDTFYKEDDDVDRKGNLIESCFRKFKNAESSYLAHSEFLLDPKKAHRYGFLFLIPSEDYRSWAHGLQSSGYATDPHYAEKIIHLIELYKLDDFDAHAAFASMMEEEMVEQTKEPEVDQSKRQNTRENVHNNSKQSKIARIEEPYFVKTDDTMERIAASFGLELEILYAFNRMPKHSQPLIGEELKLDGYIHWGKRPKFLENFDLLQNSEDELLFEHDVFAAEHKK